MNEETADVDFGTARIDKAAFRAQCGTTFRVVHDGGTVPLVLAEFVDGPSQGNLESFSLFFHGPASHMLEQAICRFDHDTLGSFSMFIVPVLGSNAERLVYQALFSRVANRPATK